MKLTINHSEILDIASSLINEKFTGTEFVANGADHIVSKIKTESGRNLIVKVGPNANTDGYVLKKLEGLDIKVPRFLGEARLSQKGVAYPLVVMTCFSGSLLKDIPAEERPLYIKEIIKEFYKIRSVKSPGKAGYVLEVASGKDYEWKEFLMRNLKGENSEFDWNKVFNFKNVNRKLLEKRIAQGKEKVILLPDNIELSLLHTDINGANIFVRDFHLEGIIDWSDAKFGDPLFDLARFRMNIRNRMDNKTLRAYFEALNLSDAELEREKTYYLLNVLDYINWYVEYGWDDMVSVQMNLLNEISD